MIGQLGVGEGAVLTTGSHRVVGIQRELVVHVEHGDILVGAADQLLHLRVRQVDCFTGLSGDRAGRREADGQREGRAKCFIEMAP